MRVRGCHGYLYHGDDKGLPPELIPLLLVPCLPIDQVVGPPADDEQGLQGGDDSVRSRCDSQGHKMSLFTDAIHEISIFKWRKKYNWILFKFLFM